MDVSRSSGMLSRHNGREVNDFRWNGDSADNIGVVDLLASAIGNRSSCGEHGVEGVIQSINKCAGDLNSAVNMASLLIYEAVKTHIKVELANLSILRDRRWCVYGLDASHCSHQGSVF